LRIVAIASASGAIVLAGCPAASDRPATAPDPPTVVVETETIEVAEVAEPATGPEDSPPTTGGAPAATESAPLAGTGAASSIEDAAPAVTIERPKDFLRPNAPDAAPREEEEPAEPPETVTDRSAEAKDPNVLPGGVPIDDLFEGLEDKPKDASKE
jgi:hypothetical protein